MFCFVHLSYVPLPPSGGSNIELDSVALSYVVLSYVTALGRGVNWSRLRATDVLS